MYICTFHSDSFYRKQYLSKGIQNSGIETEIRYVHLYPEDKSETSL